MAGLKNGYNTSETYETQSGPYSKLYTFGGRSFSIINLTDWTLVYDSGDEFERIVAADPRAVPIFNTDDEGNVREDRSPKRGMEPEAIDIITLNGRFFAIIVIEKQSAFMVGPC